MLRADGQLYRAKTRRNAVSAAEVTTATIELLTDLDLEGSTGT
jgi:hypothetical protein